MAQWDRHQRVSRAGLILVDPLSPKPRIGKSHLPGGGLSSQTMKSAPICSGTSTFATHAHI